MLSLEEMYAYLRRQYKRNYRWHFESDDKLNRNATMYAVRNTAKEWRRQYD